MGNRHILLRSFGLTPIIIVATLHLFKANLKKGADHT